MAASAFDLPFSCRGAAARPGEWNLLVGIRCPVRLRRGTDSCGLLERPRERNGIAVLMSRGELGHPVVMAFPVHGLGRACGSNEQACQKDAHALT